jgi:conjugal transfer pilus assembly protein TraD
MTLSDFLATWRGLTLENRLHRLAVLGLIGTNLITLRVLDAATQQYVTDSLPKTRLKSLLLTQGSTTHSQNPLLYTGNVGERLGEEEGDLFPPALLGQLPNLHYLAVLAGGRIVKGRLPILGTPKGSA